MRRGKRWLLLLGGGILALGILYIGLVICFTDFLVDLWWFQSLGYGGYFWQRQTYRYVIFAVVTSLFFLIFFLNFWVASRFLGTTMSAEVKPSAEDLLHHQKLAKLFRTGSAKVYAPFAFLLAVLIALPLFRQWEATLLYIFGPAAGLQDPVYGKDLSYYLFSLPIYLLLLDELLITFGLLLLALVLLYWLERRFLSKQDQRLPAGAKLHLSVLVLVIFFIAVWNFLLQRHQLLYSEAHAGLFFGPGYVEMRVILPLIWLSIFSLLGTAGVLVFYFQTRKGLKFLIVSAAVTALMLGARFSSFLPDLVTKYVVKPNEISREKPYIINNIKATLTAYDLNQVETREFRFEDIPWDAKAPQVRASLRNIPVWDREVLQAVFDQLQELRTYYDFPSIDVDRYTVNGVYQQVFLAPRELNLKELPEGVKSWINERLKYTHGYGVVMTPAAQGGEEPMTWFIHGIPPISDYGFHLAQPSIYYGLEENRPVIAPNDSREMDYPTEGAQKLVDYQGRGGVPISSLIRKLIFAINFGDKNIFFTAKTNANSRILFRRNIITRIRTLTPFFRLDHDPYMVVTSKGLYWIQDAYTVSERYPYSQPCEQHFNYIRNAVKIVIDAYNGSVNYYIADPRDPIIRAYSRIYPGLLKNLDQIPPELKPHLRYPQDLFDIQMGIYAKYHQTDPEVFYKQEDIWEFPRIQHDKKTFRMKPYHLTLNLIDQTKFEFILLCPMNPKARANLRSLCVVGCDALHYGKIIVYSFPKGALVYGPSQVDAVINQDTEISQQFSLWSLRGSQVERGKMIVIPFRGAIFYIQPVYLKAAAELKIPQLKRLIVSTGEMVVMEPSLEEGFDKLKKRLQAETERVKKRLQRLQPSPK